MMGADCGGNLVILRPVLTTGTLPIAPVPRAS